MIRVPSALASIVGVALLAACGGFKSTWPTTTAVSPQPVSVAVNCIAEQAKTLGYDVRVVDHKKGVEATRGDTSDVRFVNEMRRFDVLSATVTPASTGSKIELQAGTRSHYLTRRGTTPTDEPATENAKKDARTVLTACGGGTT